MSHYIVKCSECSKIEAECRCPSENKVVEFIVCDDCVSKQNSPKMLATRLRHVRGWYIAYGVNGDSVFIGNVYFVNNKNADSGYEFYLGTWNLAGLGDTIKMEFGSESEIMKFLHTLSVMLSKQAK